MVSDMARGVKGRVQFPLAVTINKTARSAVTPKVGDVRTPSREVSVENRESDHVIRN